MQETLQKAHMLKDCVQSLVSAGKCGLGKEKEEVNHHCTIKKKKGARQAFRANTRQCDRSVHTNQWRQSGLCTVSLPTAQAPKGMLHSGRAV